VRVREVTAEGAGVMGWAAGETEAAVVSVAGWVMAVKADVG
jgi:hypothetical protein